MPGTPYTPGTTVILDACTTQSSTAPCTRVASPPSTLPCVCYCYRRLCSTSCTCYDVITSPLCHVATMCYCIQQRIFLHVRAHCICIAFCTISVLLTFVLSTPRLGSVAPLTMSSGHERSYTSVRGVTSPPLVTPTVCPPHTHSSSLPPPHTRVGCRLPNRAIVHSQRVCSTAWFCRQVVQVQQVLTARA